MAMSRQERIVLATAGVALVGITGLALYVSSKQEKPKKPKPKNLGVKVTGAQCNTFEVTDAGQLRQQAAGAVSGAARRGPVDPFEVTRSLVRQVSKDCTSYPAKTRNPGEALLFLRVFDAVLDGMVFQKLIEPREVGMWEEMSEVWALKQGVTPEELGLG